MRIAKIIVIILGATLCSAHTYPSPRGGREGANYQLSIINYQLKITSLLEKYADAKVSGKLMTTLGREFLGTPYVAQTLEVNPTEQLVVNTSELDCTTFVETILALYLCIKNHQTTFSDYERWLTRVRYSNGIISYPTRLHYFTSWIDNAVGQGFVIEPTDVYLTPTVATTVVEANYMTTHPQLYPMLRADTTLIPLIKQAEDKICGRRQAYLPKQRLSRADVRKHIHEGDILAIVTSKRGLDTSHIGIATWQDGRLCLLHASSVHKRVVIEPRTLYQYLMNHPSQTGLRIIRPTQ